MVCRREREQAQAQLAALQTQLERMQRAAVDAKLESARALGAAQKCEAELANTRKQALATRERVKDVEHQQKVSVCIAIYFTLSLSDF